MELKLLLIIILLITLIYITYPELVIKTLESINNFIMNLFPTNNQEENMSTVSQNNPLSIPSVSTFSPNSLMPTSNTSVDPDLHIPYKYKNATYGDNYFIDDGGDGTLGLQSSLCSKSCCIPQYPLPFDLPEDELLKNSNIEYVQSNYTCNNGFQDTGCLCMTKEQSHFLNSRGGNSIIKAYPTDI